MLQAPISDRKTKTEASSKTAGHLSEQEQPTNLSGWMGRSRQSQPLQQRENLANLQKAYGNQAVLRMKGRSPAANPVQGVLQRKCACGNTAGSSGSCAECQNKQKGILQTKLQIGEAGDRYEQEADRVADRVMQTLGSKIVQDMTGSKNLSHAQPMIQRFANDEADTSTSEATEPESETAAFEPEGETEETEASTSMVLLVEDDAEGIESNQMRKSEFLSQLQDGVCTTVNEIIAVQSFTTDNCPYLAYWFDRYRNSNSQHLERVIHRYAPETVEATTAQDYISLVVERARQAATRWLNTGEVTGIPEEVPVESLNLPEASSTQEAKDVPAESQGILFKGDDAGQRETTDPQRIKAQLSSGRSLDSEVQSRMGAAFQQDFSQVRLHTDDRAAKLSANLKARAFTIGRDVAFGSGEYQPGTLIGDALIAHELAHVIQQGGAKATPEIIQKNSGEQRALEEEADRSAVGAVFSLWSGIKQAWGDLTRNALPRLKSGLRLQRCDGCGRGCSTPTPAPSTPTPAPSTPTPAPSISIPNRPSSASFSSAYQAVNYDTYVPHDNGIWEFIGGNVGRDFHVDKNGNSGNSCATRVSYGLNYDGAPISATPSDKNGIYKNDIQVIFHGSSNNKRGDNKIYIIRAGVMQNYLKQKFGFPDATLSSGMDAKNFQASLAPGQAAIFAGIHHAGLIKVGYKDPYVFADPGVLPVEVWKLSVP
jgi:Domain of unknown function (DUF4157)/Type VI secretion system (T6SS), amidase effector protein 4